AMGAAAGGIGLATGNMSLKLAPHGQGTSYLAATSLVASVTGGVAPLIGGALAHWFEAAAFSVVVRWAWSGEAGEATVIGFTRYQFLFLISAALGLYVLHRLSAIREGEEISERVVIQQFALEAVRTVNQVSTVAGLLGNLFTFGRLFERRLHSRRSAVSATADVPAPVQPTYGDGASTEGRAATERND